MKNILRWKLINSLIYLIFFFPFIPVSQKHRHLISNNLTISFLLPHFSHSRAHWPVAMSALVRIECRGQRLFTTTTCVFPRGKKVGRAVFRNFECHSMSWPIEIDLFKTSILVRIRDNDSKRNTFQKYFNNFLYPSSNNESLFLFENVSFLIRSSIRLIYNHFLFYFF